MTQHGEKQGETGRVTVCVYCASRPVPERYVRLAAEVGTGIAERGWRLVSGGGRVSMMGEVARAARAGGARTVGVIPRELVEREVADTEADELLVVDTMRERKGLMDAHATAFLALPGGIGTCEELFEVWTSRYIGMHAKPVVLLDPDGHYRPLLDWSRGLVESGFASRESLEALTVVEDVESALRACGVE
ncbi:TIGR00730 family Rossman fold protein [Actinopolyspora erythraea]|uniref:Cytokinin riboside 5'-monophosphate phosphoribohydrolase n=1 Tax=Actinopolyspora erythraea TaxID=414996 RepID=A0A223RVC0_9ACTN|nr:TIGR00730 family Rossman fold protein [Actinopolyspora erythraea]ASU79787.1 TIGR00730 family Rossman fold protein [Actinopolyspora erythraea]